MATCSTFFTFLPHPYLSTTPHLHVHSLFATLSLLSSHISASPKAILPQIPDLLDWDGRRVAHLDTTTDDVDTRGVVTSSIEVALVQLSHRWVHLESSHSCPHCVCLASEKQPTHPQQSHVHFGGKICGNKQKKKKMMSGLFTCVCMYVCMCVCACMCGLTYVC